MRNSFLIASVLLIGAALAALLTTTSNVTPSGDNLVSETVSKDIFSIQSFPDPLVGEICNAHDDCTGGYYCLTHHQVAFPAVGFCYECLTDSHCPGGRCDISISGALCTSVLVKELPSLGKVEKGYNLYKGDPLYLLSNTDPGYAKHQFYHQRFDTSSDFHITLENEVFSRPVGFDATEGGICKMTSQTNSLTTTESFKSSVEEQVKVSANGSYQGVDLGGSVGSSSYEKLSRDSMNEEMTVESSSYCSLYHFKMLSDKKKQIMNNIVPAASDELKLLGTDSSKWFKFFNTYGTHIITGGYVGAFERISLSFTQSERSKLTAQGSTFETSISVGMPQVFGLQIDKSGGQSSEFAKSFREIKSTEHGVKGGNIEDLLMTPDVIEKHLEPICDFIKNSDICYRELKNYCIAELKLADLNPGDVCRYPEESVFHCIDDNNCGEGESCESGKCVTSPTLDACDECHREEWVGCDVSPSCPAGYVKDRNENGPCWWPTVRIVCREYYPCLPCKNNLLGTCSHFNKGNGCCDNGAVCGTGALKCTSGGDSWESFQKFPTFKQCEEMTGHKYFTDIAVSCGNFAFGGMNFGEVFAESCPFCPYDPLGGNHKETLCNGDCKWKHSSDECILK